MPPRSRVLDIEAKGMREFRRALKDAGKEWPKELRAAQRDLVKPIETAARARADAYGGVRRKAKNAIRASAGARQTAVGITIGTNRYPFSSGAFFGAKRYPQFSGWVGNDWEAGAHGEGPYAINDAVADHTDRIIETYGEMVDRVARRAFDT
jgi:hypothetical protein